MRRWERIVRDIWYPDASERPGRWEMAGQNGYEWSDFLEWQKRMHVNTRTLCSCWLCRDRPRPDPQECRAEDSFRQQVEDLDDGGEYDLHAWEWEWGHDYRPPETLK